MHLVITLNNIIEINADYTINNILTGLIKERSELVIVLLESLKLFLAKNNDDDLKTNINYGKITFLSSPKKMNRIFYTLYEKNDLNEINLNKPYQIVSIANPFRLKKDKNKKYYFNLDIGNHNKDIYNFDFFTLQLIIEIFKNGRLNKRFDPTTNQILNEEENHFELAGFYDYLEEKYDSYRKFLFVENPTEDETFSRIDTSTDLWKVLRFLMMFELSYIRYDYDEKNQDDKYHPLHHIDINYTELGSYKIGIIPQNTKQWQNKFLFQIVDNNQIRLYLKENHK